MKFSRDGIPMDITPIAYENIPAKYNGVIDPEGNLYRIIPPEDLVVIHDEYARYLMEEGIKINALDIYEKNKDRLEQYFPTVEGYELSDTFDYKAFLIDVLGFCNFELAKFSKDYADIEVPDKAVFNKEMTNKQLRTLTKLVDINGINIRCLAPAIGENVDVHRTYKEKSRLVAEMMRR